MPFFFGQIIGAVKSGDHDVLMANIYYLLIFAVVGGLASFFRAMGFQVRNAQSPLLCGSLTHCNSWPASVWLHDCASTSSSRSCVRT